MIEKYPDISILKSFFILFSISLPPVIMCFGLDTFLGSGLVFATAVVYGMQVMGKK